MIGSLLVLGLLVVLVGFGAWMVAGIERDARGLTDEAEEHAADPRPVRGSVYRALPAERRGDR